MRGSIETRRSKITGRITYRPRVYVGKRDAERYGLENKWHDGGSFDRLRRKEGCDSAEDGLERLLAELKGEKPPETLVTVAELVTAYRDEHLCQLRPLSQANYDRIIDRFILPAFGERSADDVTPSDVSEWMAAMLKDGRLDGKGGMAPKYVRQCRFVLHAVYEHAVDLERLTRNPVDAARGPSVPRREFEPPSIPQIRAALLALKGTRYFVPATIAAGSAMRRGEVLGLAWFHIDLASSIVHVRRQLTEVDGKAVLTRLKTDAAKRDLELPQFVVDALKAERVRQHDLARLRGHEWTEEALVCPNHDGCAIQPDKFSRGFTAALARRGLATFRFHDLRHAVATDLLLSGMRADAVQRQLGHTNVSITLGVYAHARPSDKRLIAAAMDGLWGADEDANTPPDAPEDGTAALDRARIAPNGADVLDIEEARARRMPA